MSTYNSEVAGDAAVLFLPFKFRMSVYTDKVCQKQGRPLLEEFVPLPFSRRYWLPGEKLQYRFKFSLVPSVINELNVLLILDCTAQQHFILATSLFFKEQFHFLFLLVKCCCDVSCPRLLCLCFYLFCRPKIPQGAEKSELYILKKQKNNE